jgi:hypothetical protein
VELDRNILEVLASVFVKWNIWVHLRSFHIGCSNNIQKEKGTNSHGKYEGGVRKKP